MNKKIIKKFKNLEKAKNYISKIKLRLEDGLYNDELTVLCKDRSHCIFDINETIVGYLYEQEYQHKITIELDKNLYLESLEK